MRSAIQDTGCNEWTVVRVDPDPLLRRRVIVTLDAGRGHGQTVRFTRWTLSSFGRARRAIRHWSHGHINPVEIDLDLLRRRTNHD